MVARLCRFPLARGIGGSEARVGAQFIPPQRHYQIRATEIRFRHEESIIWPGKVPQYWQRVALKPSQATEGSLSLPQFSSLLRIDP